jgi:hypothetical protein
MGVFSMSDFNRQNVPQVKEEKEKYKNNSYEGLREIVSGKAASVPVKPLAKVKPKPKIKASRK